MNKNNETPPAKIKKHRLIAKYISIICLAGAIGFGGTALTIQHSIDKDVKNVENKQLNIITEFIHSTEYKNELQSATNKIIDEYTNNQLTYEEFVSNLNYINSIDYADEIFPQLASPDLKEKMKQSNAEIYNLKLNSNRATAVNICSLGYISSMGLSLSSHIVKNHLKEKEL